MTCLLLTLAALVLTFLILSMRQPPRGRGRSSGHRVVASLQPPSQRPHPMPPQPDTRR